MQLISFDFDDTLAILKGRKIILNPKILPFIQRFHSMEEDVEFIIVTARHKTERNVKYVQDFVTKYNLPIKEIYFTDGEFKYAALSGLKVSLHVDDNIFEIHYANEHGVSSINVTDI